MADMSCKDYPYSNDEERAEKMWYGKGCTCCQEVMSIKNTTYCSYRSGGYGHQYCDFCADHLGVKPFPCEKWSDDKKSFYKRNGFMDSGRFDSTGKLRPYTGNAAKYTPK